jgi:membrane protein
LGRVLDGKDCCRQLWREVQEDQTDTVASVVSRRSGELVSFGFLFAIWSATTGMVAVMQQLNVVYEVKEERTFLRAGAVALGLSVAFFVLMSGRSC